MTKMKCTISSMYYQVMDSMPATNKGTTKCDIVLNNIAVLFVNTKYINKSKCVNDVSKSSWSIPEVFVQVPTLGVHSG